MRFKVWLYRRGLWYSPSAAFLWEKGTLFKPGKRLEYLSFEWCTCAQAALQGLPYDPACPVHFPREENSEL